MISTEHVIHCARRVQREYGVRAKDIANERVAELERHGDAVELVTWRAIAEALQDIDGYKGTRSRKQKG